MAKIVTIFCFFIFFSLVLTIKSPIYAQCGVLDFPGGIRVYSPVFQGPLANCRDKPADLITLFLPAILGIAGFITVIIIVISGIQFITSSGNPEAAAGARGRLIFALVGFALIILAFAILQIVNKIFLGDTGVA